MISDSIGDHLRPYRANFAAEATNAIQHFCIASTCICHGPTCSSPVTLICQRSLVCRPMWD